MEIRYNPEFSLDRNREDFLFKFNEFKVKNNFEKSLGVIGSSKIDNEDQIEILLSDSLQKTIDNIGLYAIISGGTEGGTPELATKISKRLNLPTIGIIPEDGEKYALKNLLDMCIIVPRPLYGDTIWGSETPILASIPNAVVVNGGEWGTFVEVGTIMKRNKSLLKQNQPTVPIILIEKSHGLVDILMDNKNTIPCYKSLYTISNTYQLTEILVRNLGSNEKRTN